MNVYYNMTSLRLLKAQETHVAVLKFHILLRPMGVAVNQMN
jgi:hypothetical protein